MNDLALDASPLDPTDDLDPAVLPIADRARSLRLALAVQLPVLALRAGAVWWARGVLDAYAHGGGIYRVLEAEGTWRCVQLLAVASLAVTGWLFVSWTRSLYEAAPALGLSGLRHSPSSAWSFFAPVASLWVPYQMISAFHDASSPDGLAPRPGAPPPPTPRAPVAAWWSLWIGAGVVSLLGNLAASGLRTALPRTPSAELASLALLAGAALLAMRVVAAVTARAVERSRRVASPPPPMTFA
jgi:hypothetical protein